MEKKKAEWYEENLKNNLNSVKRMEEEILRMMRDYSRTYEQYLTNKYKYDNHVKKGDAEW